jgi:hypothetical protein
MANTDYLTPIFLNSIDRRENIPTGKENMPKSRTFQVNEGRMFFKCPFCKFRKIVTVTPGLRRKSVCCQKCGEKTFCALNRRRVERTSQSGRVLLLVGEDTAEVNMLNISINGVGLEMNIRSGLKVAVGREVKLKCNWNPRLFSQERYIVKSVRGFKVGLERRD